MHTIHELATQGKPTRAIAKELRLARNTVRKYLRGKPAAVARPKRRSKLDPNEEQVRRWVVEDHLCNCVTMLPRLQARGYTGGLLGNEVLASVLLDRLLHHAEVISIAGRSYRMKDRLLPTAPAATPE